MISALKLRSRQQLDTVRECLQNRKLLLFDHLKKIE